MNSFKKFLSLLAITSITVVFSACSSAENGDEVSVEGAPDKTPEEVVKEAMNNSYDVTSHSYEVNVSSNSSVEGQELSFEATLSGVQDLSDPLHPVMSLKLDGSGNLDGGTEQNVSAEVRLTNDILYFVLSEISDFDGALPQEMVAGYIGQWWQMAVPPGSFEYNSFAIGGEDENLTEEQKKMKELLKNTQFFKDVEYLGVDKDSYHYKAVLDKEAVKEFVVKAAEIEGQVVTADDKAELDEGIEMINLEGEVWVDTKLMIVRGMAGTVTVDDSGESFAVQFDAWMDDINEAVEVEAPKDATEFDPFMLLGGMGAFSMPSDDMFYYDDPAMYDEELWMDVQVDEGEPLSR